jgi:hypothetical protein
MAVSEGSFASAEGGNDAKPIPVNTISNAKELRSEGLACTTKDDAMIASKKSIWQLAAEQTRPFKSGAECG